MLEVCFLAYCRFICTSSISLNGHNLYSGFYFLLGAILARVIASIDTISCCDLTICMLFPRFLSATISISCLGYKNSLYFKAFLLRVLDKYTPFDSWLCCCKHLSFYVYVLYMNLSSFVGENTYYVTDCATVDSRHERLLVEICLKIKTSWRAKALISTAIVRYLHLLAIYETTFIIEGYSC